MALTVRCDCLRDSSSTKLADQRRALFSAVADLEVIETTVGVVFQFEVRYVQNYLSAVLDLNDPNAVSLMRIIGVRIARRPNYS